jgi:hypothetical protein
MKTVQALMVPDEAAKAIRNCAVTSAEHITDSTSTLAMAEVALIKAYQDITVVGAYVLPGTTVTPASGSNTQTYQITRYDAAGANGVTVALGTIANATPATQWVAKALTLSTVVTVPAGYSLTAKSTLVGTCTLPMGKVVVDATLDGSTAI